MKKILILTIAYGSGHITASKSIQKALEFLYPDKIDSEVIELLSTEVFLNTGKFFKKLYKFSMEYPIIWDIFFTLTNSKLTSIYFEKMFSLTTRKIYKMFDQKAPVLCITTHPYWNFIVDNYNKRKFKKLKYICVVTDSTEVHSIWESKKADFYVTCDEDTKKNIQKLGVRSDKIFIFGFPVNPEFLSPFDKKNFLFNLGLSNNIPTFLIIFGLGKLKIFFDIIEHSLKTKNLRIQMIIITGKYKDIYNLLTKMNLPESIKIIGWTDKMHNFIRAADLIISKAGGAITFESFEAGKPILVPVFCPGQERGNVKSIKKFKLGVVETDYNKIIEILENFILNPSKLQKLSENVKEYVRTNAAFKIAKFIYEKIIPDYPLTTENTKTF